LIVWGGLRGWTGWVWLGFCLGGLFLKGFCQGGGLGWCSLGFASGRGVGLGIGLAVGLIGFRGWCWGFGSFWWIGFGLCRFGILKVRTEFGVFGRIWIVFDSFARIY
jgi:hypothetical protein